jgi:hypothetical protein
MDWIDEVKNDWDEQWGDRKQELVFIGVSMKKDQILKHLNNCLLSDEEMQLGPEGWKEFEDPIQLQSTIHEDSQESAE